MDEDVYFDIFLSYVWGKDTQGRDNHERVAVLAGNLQEVGLKVWVNENMTVDIRAEILQGKLAKSKYFGICLSEHYMEIIEDETSWIGKEFQMAMTRPITENLEVLVILMEQGLRDSQLWSKKLKFFDLHNAPCTDFTKDTFLVKAVMDISRKVNNFNPNTENENMEEPGLWVSPRMDIVQRAIDFLDEVEQHMLSPRVQNLRNRDLLLKELDLDKSQLGDVDCKVIGTLLNSNSHWKTLK